MKLFLNFQRGCEESLHFYPFQGLLGAVDVALKCSESGKCPENLENSSNTEYSSRRTIYTILGECFFFFVSCLLVLNNRQNLGSTGVIQNTIFFLERAKNMP